MTVYVSFMADGQPSIRIACFLSRSGDAFFVYYAKNLMIGIGSLGGTDEL